MLAKYNRFLDIVIDVLGKGETKKRRLKNLCKTRWIERHSTFESIYDLYKYVVTTLDEICVPSEDERFECPGKESWDWDASTRTLANGLRQNEKLWAHFLFCVRDGHAGTNETTCQCTPRLPRRSLFWLQKSGGGHEFLY